ncbi:MAG: response regulator [Pyrinomonadaceae bacterium]
MAGLLCVRSAEHRRRTTVVLPLQPTQCRTLTSQHHPPRFQHHQFAAGGSFHGLERIGKLYKTLRQTKERIKHKHHLLIVDDEEAICFSMQQYFSHSGFIVDIAHEIAEAERLIEDQKYEVIIQDLRLGPAKYPDGLEMIRLAHRVRPETRIVVLTAYGDSELEGEAKRSGADVFLRKPQRLSQVAQVVEQLIQAPPSQ